MVTLVISVLFIKFRTLLYRYFTRSILISLEHLPTTNFIQLSKLFKYCHDLIQCIINKNLKNGNKNRVYLDYRLSVVQFILYRSNFEVFFLCFVFLTYRVVKRGGSRGRWSKRVLQVLGGFTSSQVETYRNVKGKKREGI